MSKRSTRRRVFFVLSLAGLGLAVALWLHGQDYYLSNLWDRPDHPQHAALKSSGAWGHGLGLIGALVILINLSFLLRRHLRSFRRFGSLRNWMDLHVITGLLGPLLIFYHTAIDFRSDVAITAAVSLGILVVTGVVGRFIYTMVPHTVAGAELGRKALDKKLEDARAELAARLSEDDPLWAKVQSLGRETSFVPTTRIGCLVFLPIFLAGGAARRLALRRLSRQLRKRFGGESIDWFETLHTLVVIRSRLQVLRTYRSLLQWWRAMHRVLAVIMVVMMLIHVLVASYFGYTGEAVGW